MKKVILCALALCGVPSFALAQAEPATPEFNALTESVELGFDQFVCIKRRGIFSSHVYTYHQEGFSAGSDLLLCTFKDGTIEKSPLFSSQTGLILDADLSRDAKTVLFSYKDKEDGFFHIYEIGVDGTGLRQITTGNSNNYNACWLPGDAIAFLSDRTLNYAYCWITTVGRVYRMERDGSKVVRLSANYLNDFTPSVTSSGAILFGRWEYVDAYSIPHQALWKLNPDGTGMAGVYGMRVITPGSFMDAREIPGSNKILCTVTGHGGSPHGGVGIIDPSIGGNEEAALEMLTPEVQFTFNELEGMGNRPGGQYNKPYPIDDRFYFVTKSTGKKWWKDGGLELRSYDQKTKVSVFKNDGAYSYYSAQALIKRPAFPVVPSILAEDADAWATIMMQDVYNGLLKYGNIKRGEIKQLAVVQEVEKWEFGPKRGRFFGHQHPVVSAGTTYAPKKLWGLVDVEPDGSAVFKVPANQPVYFLALDKEGRAVQRMRTFTHFMPSEIQGCVGCHADRNYATPTMRRGTALSKPPQELVIPEWAQTEQVRQGISYPKMIQPVFDAHCVSCHGAKRPAADLDLSGDKTDFFNVSYENLARRGTLSERWTVNLPGRTPLASEGHNPYTSLIYTYNGLEANRAKISPKDWGSPRSLLVDKIMTGHPAEQPGHHTALCDADRRKIMLWIDMNGPYYDLSKNSRPNVPGCRRILHDDFGQVFTEIAQRRCVSCHNYSNPKLTPLADPERWPTGYTFGQKPEKYITNYGDPQSEEAVLFDHVAHAQYYTAAQGQAAGLVPVPMEFYLRWEKPELNTFLLAPLAESAGGTGMSGKSVFKDQSDPDYQTLLNLLKEMRTDAERLPRIDM